MRSIFLISILITCMHTNNAVSQTAFDRYALRLVSQGDNGDTRTGTATVLEHSGHTYLVTALHVIHNSTNIGIVKPGALDNDPLPITTILGSPTPLGCFPEADIAVLRLSAAGSKSLRDWNRLSLRLIDANTTQSNEVGSWVAVGNPKFYRLGHLELAHNIPFPAFCSESSRTLGSLRKGDLVDSSSAAATRILLLEGRFIGPGFSGGPLIREIQGSDPRMEFGGIIIGGDANIPADERKSSLPAKGWFWAIPSRDLEKLLAHEFQEMPPASPWPQPLIKNIVWFADDDRSLLASLLRYVSTVAAKLPEPSNERRAQKWSYLDQTAAFQALIGDVYGARETIRSMNSVQVIEREEQDGVTTGYILRSRAAEYCAVAEAMSGMPITQLSTVMEEADSAEERVARLGRLAVIAARAGAAGRAEELLDRQKEHLDILTAWNIKAECALLCAKVCRARGDLSNAEKALGNARELLATAPDYPDERATRKCFRHQIICELVALGHEPQAKELVSGLFCKSLLIAYAIHGQRNQALEFASSIERIDWRGDAMLEAAKACARKGDIDTAVSFLYLYHQLPAEKLFPPEPLFDEMLPKSKDHVDDPCIGDGCTTTDDKALSQLILWLDCANEIIIDSIGYAPDKCRDLAKTTSRALCELNIGEIDSPFRQQHIVGLSLSLAMSHALLGSHEALPELFDHIGAAVSNMGEGAQDDVLLVMALAYAISGNSARAYKAADGLQNRGLRLTVRQFVSSLAEGGGNRTKALAALGSRLETMADANTDALIQLSLALVKRMAPEMLTGGLDNEDDSGWCP
ncbi:MAG: hypothetical protein FLDDKLPJ_03300 [Phycisphaerae bacterium]|nr:hypothetical protein [Phycisphaerae bacterium]